MGVFLVRLYVGARSSIVNTTIHRANLVDHHKNLAQCFLNGPRTTPTSGGDEEISRRNLDGRLAVFRSNHSPGQPGRSPQKPCAVFPERSTYHANQRV